MRADENHQPDGKGYGKALEEHLAEQQQQQRRGEGEITEREEVSRIGGNPVHDILNPPAHAGDEVYLPPHVSSERAQGSSRKGLLDESATSSPSVYLWQCPHELLDVIMLANRRQSSPPRRLSAARGRSPEKPGITPPTAISRQRTVSLVPSKASPLRTSRTIRRLAGPRQRWRSPCRQSPIRDAIRPSGKAFDHHRVVFGLLEGNNEISVFESASES